MGTDSEAGARADDGAGSVRRQRAVNLRERAAATHAPSTQVTQTDTAATKTSAQQTAKAQGETTTTGTTAAQKTATIDVGGEKGRVAPGSRKACIEWAQGWPAPQRGVILEQCKNIPR
jgi:hypothetical protein